jgi:hypothetical protein
MMEGRRQGHGRSRTNPRNRQSSQSRHSQGVELTRSFRKAKVSREPLLIDGYNQAAI